MSTIIDFEEDSRRFNRFNKLWNKYEKKNISKEDLVKTTIKDLIKEERIKREIRK